MEMLELRNSHMVESDRCYCFGHTSLATYYCSLGKASKKGVFFAIIQFGGMLST